MIYAEKPLKEKCYFSRKGKIYLIILLICIQIISLFISIVVNQVGLDFYYYYTNTVAYWRGTNKYCSYGFVYLNYFYYLFIWVIFFPITIAAIIHIIITDLMFYYIIKNINNYERKYWLFGNLFMFLFWSATLNVNTWIIFSFIVYQKYVRKWYSPFVLLFSFYKIITIPVFVIIFLINLKYEKKIRLKQIIPLSFVFIITIISFFYSINSILYNNEKLGKYRYCSLIHLSHLIWLTFPLALLLENKTLNIINLKKIWMNFCIISIIWMLILYLIIDFKAFLIFYNIFIDFSNNVK